MKKLMRATKKKMANVLEELLSTYLNERDDDEKLKSQINFLFIINL
mgnify:CR=1 FL=1